MKIAVAVAVVFALALGTTGTVYGVTQAGKAAAQARLSVLKRVVEHHHQDDDAGSQPVAQVAPADAEHAARLALAASIAASNPISQRQMMTRFGPAASNGYGRDDHDEDQ